MSLLEEWPSNKYDTGFEFEKLIEDVDDVPYAVYSALRVCTKTKDAVGFDAQYPAEWGISIDRGIAEKAGRRGMVIDQVNQQVSLFVNQLKAH